MTTDFDSQDLTYLAQLPIETCKEKCDRFMQSCLNVRDPEVDPQTNPENVKRTLAYIKLLSAKNSGKETEKKGGNRDEIADELGDSTECSRGSKDDGYKTLSFTENNNVAEKSDDDKVVGKEKRRGTKRGTKMKETNLERRKLESLIKKILDLDAFDENINELKKFLSETDDSRRKLFGVINSINTYNRKYSMKLKNLILEIMPDAELKKFEEYKEILESDKNEDGSDSLKHKQSVGKNKRSKEKNCDDSNRRRSLRLASHPPGYFQTKPIMIFYMEPAINCKRSVRKRKSASSVSNKKQVGSEFVYPLRHSVPKVKRRKLYDPNGDSPLAI